MIPTVPQEKCLVTERNKAHFISLLKRKLDEVIELSPVADSVIIVGENVDLSILFVSFNKQHSICLNQEKEKRNFDRTPYYLEKQFALNYGFYTQWVDVLHILYTIKEKPYIENYY